MKSLDILNFLKNGACWIYKVKHGTLIALVRLTLNNLCLIINTTSMSNLCFIGLKKNLSQVKLKQYNLSYLSVKFESLDV